MSKRKKIILNVFVLFVGAIFISLPFFVTPSMAHPLPGFLSPIVLVIAAIIIIYPVKSHSPTSLLLGYSFVCASIWLSSMSWFGMPFIDAVFMITAFLSFIANLILLSILFLKLLSDSRKSERGSKTKRKNIILWIICTLTVVATVVLVIVDRDPFPAIFLGCFVMFLVYALLPVPPKHKDFSYEDQQRAFRAFDRTDLIDPGVPDWAKGKRKK